jgi:hypothetical protein
LEIDRVPADFVGVLTGAINRSWPGDNHQECLGDDSKYLSSRHSSKTRPLTFGTVTAAPAGHVPTVEQLTALKNLLTNSPPPGLRYNGKPLSCEPEAWKRSDISFAPPGKFTFWDYSKPVVEDMPQQGAEKAD